MRYSFSHIAMLIFLAAACFFTAWFYANAIRRRFPDGLPAGTRAKRHPAALAVGGILCLSDIVYYMILVINGMLTVYNLPLHLCTMTVYLVFVHALFPADWLGQTLYALCLPGVWAALLFPDWISYPFFSYTSLRCYLVHGAIAAYIIMQTAAGIIRPRWSAIWKPVLFLCIISPFILWINYTYRANYMFLSQPAEGSPLVFLWDLAGGGQAFYLLYFGILTLCGMSILYLPFFIWRRIRRDV